VVMCSVAERHGKGALNKCRRVMPMAAAPTSLDGGPAAASGTVSIDGV
jgi:hypothetical protein